MRRAIYVRVSTQRQTQIQTIDQQLERLRAHFQLQGWEWREDWVFRDNGYSGASLKRPGLDRLRDHVAQAHFDRVLMTAPDRLARKYVHQISASGSHAISMAVEERGVPSLGQGVWGTPVY